MAQEKKKHRKEGRKEEDKAQQPMSARAPLLAADPEMP